MHTINDRFFSALGHYLLCFYTALCCLGITPVLCQNAQSYEQYLDEGWHARQQREFKTAENAYRQAIAVNPNGNDAQIGLFYTYIEQGNFTKAEAMLAGLLTIMPYNMWVRKGAAWTLFNRKKYAEAAEHYRYILNEAGEDSEMRLGLGLSLVKTGQQEEGRQECRKCQEELAGDPRLAECLREDTSKWRFMPQVYAAYTAHSRDSDRYTAAASLDLELLHTSGIGLFYQATYLYSQNYANQVNGVSLEDPGKYNEFSSGVAAYYLKSDYFLWLYGGLMSGEYENAGAKDRSLSWVTCLYGNYSYKYFYLGACIATGVYDDFTVFQGSPEIGIYLNKELCFKLVPTFHGSDGTPKYSNSEKKNRASIAFTLDGKWSWLNLHVSICVGDRWFTIEDKGLFVWNTDKEFDWGARIKAYFYPGRPFSPYLGFRLDKVEKENGEKQNFYLIGLSGGFLLNF